MISESRSLVAKRHKEDIKYFGFCFDDQGIPSNLDRTYMKFTSYERLFSV